LQIDHVRQHTWPSAWSPQWNLGKDVHHSTVGIIGLGRIGEKIAKRLRGFDCKILYDGPFLFVLEKMAFLFLHALDRP
jgi:lactate dehydrogenase-like 2-hydroxyacid dehydrogenase